MGGFFSRLKQKFKEIFKPRTKKPKQPQPPKPEPPKPQPPKSQPQPPKPQLSKPEPPNLGDITYQRLLDLIDTYSEHQGSEVLKNLLNHEIKKYGRDKVIAALAQSDETLIEIATNLVGWDSSDGGKDEISRRYDALANLIRGTIATEDEAKVIGRVTETFDNMTDEILL